MLDPEWLIGLTIVVALALPSDATGQGDTPQSITDSRSITETSAAVSDQEPPIQRPAIGIGGPLSVAEIRWCMSQEIGLQAIQPRLGTREAIDRYNKLADEFNRRCNARPYSRSDGAEAAAFIDSARNEIVGAAIDDIQRHNGSALTRQIQELLERLGYEPGAIDGVYGTQTKAAIEAFQQRVGYPADGLLSERLLGRLQVENMRRLTGRETAPVVNVAVIVMEAPQGAESDTEAVADAQVIVSGDRGFTWISRPMNEGGSNLAAYVPASWISKCGGMGIDSDRRFRSLKILSRSSGLLFQRLFQRTLKDLLQD